MLKVFIRPDMDLQPRGIYRVADALGQYAPMWTESVSHFDEADLVVIHCIDYEGTVKKIERARANNQQYGLIQYCLKTTSKPNASEWVELWEQAAIVWSYYDLAQYLYDEDVHYDFQSFYHAPLGVDSDIFRKVQHTPREFKVLTCGYVAESECIGEVATAAHNVKSRVVHVGPDLGIFNRTDLYSSDITDVALVTAYNSCQYVTGLRRGKGFELPVIEGLLCGCRPIVFDRPHYTNWFDEWAISIPEDTDSVVRNLQAIFKYSPSPVTTAEIAEVTRQFDWSTIIHEFWDRVVPQQKYGRLVQ